MHHGAVNTDASITRAQSRRTFEEERRLQHAIRRWIDDKALDKVRGDRTECVGLRKHLLERGAERFFVCRELVA